MLVRIVILLVALLGSSLSAPAQTADLQQLLQQDSKAVERASRKTIDPLLKSLIDSKLEAVPLFLEKWQSKEVWFRETDGLFYYVESPNADPMVLLDISSGKTCRRSSKRRNEKSQAEQRRQRRYRRCPCPVSTG